MEENGRLQEVVQRKEEELESMRKCMLMQNARHELADVRHVQNGQAHVSRMDKEFQEVKSVK